MSDVLDRLRIHQFLSLPASAEGSVFREAEQEILRLENELLHADAINAELHAMLERVRMRSK